MTTYNHFIIAGTEKAGTTSVFSYLSGHPAISASQHKETDFFRGTPPLSYADYLQFFPKRNHASDTILMESSPGYLSESGKVSKHMRELLPTVRLLFILRNPVERFISSYKFHVGRLNIDENISFDDYCDMCFHFYTGKNTAEQYSVGEWYLRTLEQGLYAKKLAPFFSCFSSEQIQILFFDELKTNPLLFMRKICSFLGISFDYFRDYHFEKKNITFAGRNKFLHRLALDVNDKLEPFFRSHQHLKRHLLSLYKRVNGATPGSRDLSPENALRLQQFYAPDCRALASLLSCSPRNDIPWLKANTKS